MSSASDPAFVHVPLQALKGRGSATRLAHRFEPTAREPFDDGWVQEGDEPAPVPTTWVWEDCKSAITRNTSPDIGFDLSINPYRGCEHGCSYCYARPSHSYLGLSPGLDFETRLIAKRGLQERLIHELASPRYRPGLMAVGTVTDAYQPLERELRSAIVTQGAALATSQKDAQVTLRILSDVQEKKTLTLNAQGQVREFYLNYRLRFEVVDSKNRKLLTPEEIVLQSYLSYSESQALAKEIEERLTYIDLRRDAVNQVMRQLVRLQPPQLSPSGEQPATANTANTTNKASDARAADADDLPVQPPTCAVAAPEDCK